MGPHLTDFLDPAEIAAATRVLADKRLLPFCLQMFPEYIVADHIRLVAEKLEAVERGEIKRLVISMPPRHGKSQLASIFFPAWFLGKNPDKRVILTAHTADLAENFSRQCRNLLLDLRWPFPSVKLAKDSQSVSNWNLAAKESGTNLRGGLTAAGIGGPITGFGGHLLLIDDPIKNAEEANSRRALQSQLDWYYSTLYTRQEKDAAIIMTMTRWTEGDLAGVMLEEAANNGEKWEEIRLPALATSGDALGREPGKALWPGKYSEEVLETTKRTLPPREWSALYQQRPVPDEGLYFKRDNFRYFSANEDAYVLHKPSGDVVAAGNGLYRFMTVDLAISEKQTADYTVFLSCGVTTEGDLLILDVTRERLSGESLEKRFEMCYNTWHPDTAYIESVGFQAAVIQNLRRRIPHLPVIELKADRDKVTRAIAISDRLEAGQVYFRKGAAWLGDFEHELLTFPAGRHDDMVDTLAYAGAVHAKRHFGPSHPAAKRRMTGWAN